MLPDSASTMYGRLAPAMGGDLASTAPPFNEVVLVKGGGVTSAEWAYKYTAYQGKDDARHIWGAHRPYSLVEPGGSNLAVVYASTTREIVLFSVASGSTTAYLRRRNVDTARYDIWTSNTATLVRAPATGEHGAALVELPNGRLLLALRVDGSGAGGGVGPAYDFDLYVSDDAGLTWLLAAPLILERFTNGTYPDHDLNCQIRMSIAGEHIRLTWIEATVVGRVNTWLSRDRGITWTSLAVGPTFVRSADADDRVVYDLVGLDDAGSFVMAGYTGGFGAVVNYYAADIGAWTITSVGGTAYGVGVRPVAVYFVRHPLWIYRWVFFSDLSAGANDGYDVIRFRPFDYGTPSAVQRLPTGQACSTIDGADWLPCRQHGVWAGREMVHVGARKSESGGADIVASSCVAYSDAWTQRSLGAAGPGAQLQAYRNELFGRWWVAALGRPTNGAGTTWTQTATGGAADTVSTAGLAIVCGAGQTLYYEHSLGNLAGIMFNLDACFRFVMVIPASGTGSTLIDQIAARIKIGNATGTQQYDVSVRYSSTSVRLVDNIAGATLCTVSGTFQAATATEVRVRKSGATFEIFLWDVDNQWYSSGTGIATPGIIVGASNLLRFGCLAAPASGSADSTWREVMWSTDGTQLNQGLSFPLLTPTAATGLFGASCSGIPQETEGGITIGWAGVGGIPGNAWQAVIDYSYPVSATLVDSPRITWRSTDLATQTIILSASLTNTAARLRHDAIAVFGCNNRQLLIDYDSDPTWPSSTATQTLDFTRYGTGTTPRTVLARDGNSLTIQFGAGYPWVAGELVGMYVRVISGVAIGLTWRVTRHSAVGIVQFDEETTTLASQGLAAGDLFVIFGGAAALKYSAAVSERYMRIRTTDSDTAEGYHQIGTVVVGRSVAVDVPMDWAHTDDQQPNTTRYRTKSGIGWAYSEGPPQRTLEGRVLGDAEQWRDKFRAMMGNIGYDARCVAFVYDGDRIAETVMLARVESGGPKDNAAWYDDAAGYLRQAGDMSLVLVEEV
ncbi:MAG: hypothetical protein KGS10_05475 [Chloroflexi bacterium]|nr:hypothetical protein [Chloroflexota bacterium]